MDKKQIIKSLNEIGIAAVQTGLSAINTARGLAADINKARMKKRQMDAMKKKKMNASMIQKQTKVQR